MSMLEIIKNNKKPLFQNPSPDLIYLGSNEVSDFYCSKDDSINNNGSLIIRLGDKPSDNFSMPADVAKNIINSGELEDDSVFALCYRRYLKTVEGKSKTL